MKLCSVQWSVQKKGMLSLTRSHRNDGIHTTKTKESDRLTKIVFVARSNLELLSKNFPTVSDLKCNHCPTPFGICTNW